MTDKKRHYIWVCTHDGTPLTGDVCPKCGETYPQTKPAAQLIGTTVELQPCTCPTQSYDAGCAEPNESTCALTVEEHGRRALEIAADAARVRELQRERDALQKLVDGLRFAKAVVSSAYDDAAPWAQDGPLWKSRAESAEAAHKEACALATKFMYAKNDAIAARESAEADATRLRQALAEILDRFPSPNTIEDLKADVGYGHRPCMMNPTPKDSDVVRWRTALAPTGGAQPKGGETK